MGSPTACEHEAQRRLRITPSGWIGTGGADGLRQKQFPPEMLEVCCPPSSADLSRTQFPTLASHLAISRGTAALAEPADNTFSAYRAQSWDLHDSHKVPHQMRRVTIIAPKQLLLLQRENKQTRTYLGSCEIWACVAMNLHAFSLLKYVARAGAKCSSHCQSGAAISPMHAHSRGGPGCGEAAQQPVEPRSL